MNLPNKLTLTRIILVPVFMVFVSLTQIGTEDFNPTWYLVAGIIFAATKRAQTLPNGTQIPERTEWHNIVVWRGIAETAKKYLHKGDKVYVEGEIRSRSFEDKNGVRHTVVEIFAESMEMVTVKQQTQHASSDDELPC